MFTPAGDTARSEALPPRRSGLAGPLALGRRELPEPAQRVVAVLAPALLAGLVVTEIAGEYGQNLDPAIVIGVLTAGGARMFRAPPLLAVALGAAAAAGMRALRP